MQLTAAFVLAALSSLATAVPQVAITSSVFATPTASTITQAPVSTSAASVPANGTATVTVTKLIYPAGLPEEYIAFLLGNVNNTLPAGTASSEPASNGTVTSSRSSRPTTSTFIGVTNSTLASTATFTLPAGTAVTSSASTTPTGAFPQPDITAYPPPCGFFPGFPNTTVTFSDFPTATSNAGTPAISTGVIGGTDSGIVSTLAATPARRNFASSTTSAGGGVVTVSSSALATATVIASSSAGGVGTATPVPAVCIPYTTTEIYGTGAFPTGTTSPTSTTADSSVTATVDSSE